MNTEPQFLSKLFKSWHEAVAQKAFQKEISLEDFLQSYQMARRRSFQRLLQALFRENLIQEAFIQYVEQTQLNLQLTNHQSVVIDYFKSYPMKSFVLKGEVRLKQKDQYVSIDSPSQLLKLLIPILNITVHSEALHRFCHELDDSLKNDVLCLVYHQYWNRQLGHIYPNGLIAGLLKDRKEGHNPTVLLEQWGTLGHPWHPNYKTKLGLETAKVIEYSPEFDATIDLVMGAIKRSKSRVSEMPTISFLDWFSTEFSNLFTYWRKSLLDQNLNPEDYYPLPIHPYQAENFLPQAFKQDIENQEIIIHNMPSLSSKPSMSFRTVITEKDRQYQGPLIKTPVSLRLTSVERTISPRSVVMGPRVSRLLTSILEKEPEYAQYIKIAPELYGLSYQPEGLSDEQARHVGTLFRENPIHCTASENLVIPVGALFADYESQPLLHHWLKYRQTFKASTLIQEGLDFYKEYVHQAIEGLIGLYLKYGIAFEAHQQNSFIVMKPNGAIAHLLIRDFGDIRISRQALNAQGMDLELHDLKKTLFDDEKMVRDKCIHTTLLCHLGELALLTHQITDIEIETLWGLIKKQLEETFKRTKPFTLKDRYTKEYHALLEANWPAKSFVKMRLQDTSEDIVGVLPNPLMNLKGKNNE